MLNKRIINLINVQFWEFYLNVQFVLVFEMLFKCTIFLFIEYFIRNFIILKVKWRAPFTIKY